VQRAEDPGVVGWGSCEGLECLCGSQNRRRAAAPSQVCPAAAVVRAAAFVQRSPNPTCVAAGKWREASVVRSVCVCVWWCGARGGACARRCRCQAVVQCGSRKVWQVVCSAWGR